MPVPRSRPAEATVAGLVRWYRDCFPEAVDVAVTLVPSPRATGFSCETVLFDVEAAVDGRHAREELAARVQPDGYTLYRDHDLDRQWRVIEAVHQVGTVPVPRILAGGTGREEYLGTPFFVMERRPGLTCSDAPPYSMKGWLKDAEPIRQRRVVERSIDVLAAIHAVDTSKLPEEHLARLIPPGIHDQVHSYGEFLAWVEDGRTVPDLDDAYDWLRAGVPDHPERGLCWGDARIGNMLYADDRPSAVLDWEMVALGPPESDLAWWLVFDRIHTEGRDVPRLPGFPTEKEMVARYQDLTGRPVRQLHYYQVWAALRAAALLYRFQDMLVLSGIAPDEAHAAYQPAFRVLRRLMDDAR
ncbi:MAG TPA: phosphotransferase family protein [Acidimicrobiales bacterium]|jgi:aminoglycoside phosphotransferase (APT) family kinase protein|nr:phosphotransferase family protein [Acidimicrobiales bacterium]